MLTLAELNEMVIADRNKIGALVDSYKREERLGTYKLRWALENQWCMNYDTAVSEQTDNIGSYVPTLLITIEHGMIRLPMAPGAAISRYGEIKTAIEVWIAGNGPWPEPKTEEMETVQPEPPPVLPPVPPPPPPERDIRTGIGI